MLANFEKRYFENEIRIWRGEYHDLQNIVHWHYEAELIYVREGLASIGVNKDSFEAKAGDLVFCASGDMHRINSQKAGTICEIIIFDGGFMRHILCKWPAGLAYIEKSVIDQEQLPADALFLSVARELKAQECFAADMIQAQLIHFFTTLLRKLALGNRKTELSNHKKKLIQAYQELLRYIDDHFAEVRFEDAAAFMHFSAPHFSKRFKEISGMSFTEYLNHVRISKAVEMLQTTENSVTSISSLCGFNNIRSFNRIFKAITGITPSAVDAHYTLSTTLHPVQNKNVPFDATISLTKLIT